MKVCPECARSYSDEAVVCAFDGTPLSSGTTAAWEQDKVAEPIEGDVLGSYRIVSEIGRGGMGVIFEAEHVRLGRRVALKVLKARFVRRTDILHRFFAEARAVNEIGHPHITDINDFVEIVDQDPPLVYMVMELLRGVNLADYLRATGPLDPEQAVAIADQVADALEAVHQVEILHRDLKPENIFLQRTEEVRPAVKLLDFGVAKVFGERQGESLTSPGTAVGTPEYMPPEQVLEREMDARSDIYGLGLVLYEMLSGDVPFKSAETGYADVLKMQVERPPPPLSRQSASGTEIPAELVQIVMRCLEKDPAQRFQSASQLRAALKGVGQRMAQYNVDVETEIVRPSSSNPRKWLMVGLAAGLLAAGAAIILLTLVAPSEEPARAAIHASARLDAIGAPSAPSVDGGGATLDGPAADLERSNAADAAAAAADAAALTEPRSRRRARRHRRRRRRHRTPTKASRKKPRPTASPKAKKKRGNEFESTVDPFSM
jgi:eukaryotic-like serine/threonine-protein kinase